MHSSINCTKAMPERLIFKPLRIIQYGGYRERLLWLESGRNITVSECK